jgi:hypothetical protein
MKEKKLKTLKKRALHNKATASGKRKTENGKYLTTKVGHFHYKSGVQSPHFSWTTFTKETISAFAFGICQQ